MLSVPVGRLDLAVVGGLGAVDNFALKFVFERNTHASKTFHQPSGRRNLDAGVREHLNPEIDVKEEHQKTERAHDASGKVHELHEVHVLEVHRFLTKACRRARRQRRRRAPR